VPSDKTTYKSKALRLESVGPNCKDKIIDYLCKHAETLYIPKKIHGPGDWLVSYTEKG
jgi:hypothetical protein